MILLPCPSPRYCHGVLSFQRGNPSGGDLAPSNSDAKDAVTLFQSSYIFTEGLDSLGKATGAMSKVHSKPNATCVSRGSEKEITRYGRVFEIGAGSGGTSGQDGGATTKAGERGSNPSSLGKRGRGDNGEGLLIEDAQEAGASRVNAPLPPRPPQPTGTTALSPCRKNEDLSSPGAGTDGGYRSINGSNEGSTGAKTSAKRGWSGSTLGNPGVAAVLCRSVLTCCCTVVL